MARLIKKERVGAQPNKIRNEKELKTNTTEIQRIIRDDYVQPYANKRTAKRKGQILKKAQSPKTEQEETENMNRPITSHEIELVIKNF